MHMTKLRKYLLLIFVSVFVFAGVALAGGGPDVLFGDSTVPQLSPVKIDSNGNIAPTVATRGLQLGVKTSDPTGYNGLTYYNSST